MARIIAGLAPSHILRLGPLALKLLPVVALVLFGSLLWGKVSSLDGGAVWAALKGMSAWQIIAALFFTGLSFQAVGAYDALMHRVLGNDVPRGQARRAGMRAIALSQTLGFGTLTGAFTRWRLLPTLSLGAATKLSALVSISFIGALAIVTALVLPVSGLSPGRAGWLVPLGLVAAGGLAALSLVAYRKGWISAALTPGTVLALITATFLDTSCAAAALWVLWPDGSPFGLVFAAYLVALGAGLLSNAPGGVGAFDLALLALLPHTAGEPAMAALLVFRALYYALPACLALSSLLWPEQPTRLKETALLGDTPPIPEAGLARQGAVLVQDETRAYLGLCAPLTLAIKGAAPHLPDLTHFAKAHFRRPALYQCNRQAAVAARAQGWRLLRCAQEAIIPLADWTLDTPKRRQLRRNLRSFEASDLRAYETQNLSGLSDVAQAWAAEHGGERGTTMGRFCPDYLRHQRVFVASDARTPVAFVSFHADGTRWTLDLVRHVSPLPSGVMHALITLAIDAARHEGVKQLSLAAVTDIDAALPFADRHNQAASGLRRFKQSFAPNWHPRFIAAPSWPDLALAALSLSWSVHRPRDLSNLSNHAPSMRRVQDNNARFSFETRPGPCDALATCPDSAGATSHVHRCPDPPA